MAVKPMGARDDTSTVPAGINFADELDKPF
jgi:hypothetical protein